MTIEKLGRERVDQRAFGSHKLLCPFIRGIEDKIALEVALFGETSL